MIEDASEQITLWKRWGTTHTSNSIHMIENDRGIVKGIAIYETVHCFKSKLMGGFFGMAFGVEDVNKYIVQQAGFREQGMVRGASFWCLQ